jgi:hypothetical protein
MAVGHSGFDPLTLDPLTRKPAKICHDVDTEPSNREGFSNAFLVVSQCRHSFTEHTGLGPGTKPGLSTGGYE